MNILPRWYWRTGGRSVPPALGPALPPGRTARAVAGMWLALAASAGFFSGSCVASSAPLQPEQAPKATEFATAADLLAALETADRGLRRLSADVEFTKIFGEGGDVHKRVGKLWFASDPPPAGAATGTPDHRRFAVEFKEFYRDDRKETDPQSYAFDGQWLMEKHPADKTFHLRQVVRPGEAFDPLKIGQGPFPLPIGQKKDDILAQYDAALLPTADGLTPDIADADDSQPAHADVLIKDLEETHCWQVRLTPKPGQDNPDFAEVRLWYMKDATGRLLPRMARTVAATGDPAIKGDISIVHLINVKVNDHAKVSDDVFSITRPDGWQGVVDELPKQSQPAGPPPSGG